MSTASSTSGRSVPSVLRAAQILQAVGAADGAVALSELSRSLGIARSTALNICAALVDAELLARSDVGGYRLGPAVVALGRRYLDQSDIVSEFKAVPLGDGTLAENTLVLSTLDGATAIYLARRPGTRPGGLTFHVGERIPAHCSASGLALLSRLSTDEIRNRYSRAPGFQRLTSRSIGSIDELIDELAAIRARGFAVDDEGTALGMLGLGVALDVAADEIPVGIGVSLIKSTVTATMQERIGDELISVAQGLRGSAGRRSVAG